MLLKKFAQQLAEYAPHQQKFLIAFSGGLDSTALLWLFKQLSTEQPQLKIRAIHIHHGLSHNADYWAQHCAKLCHQFDIPLLIERVQVDLNQGIEAGAREARYQAISAHLHKQEWLVTAHHQQDQAETFLLALSRGSGVQGLGAMRVHNHIFGIPIFRPLLTFTRAELTQLVREAKLPWIEDESNAENQYARNFLRNHVFPLLHQRWPQFDQAVQRTAQHCAEQQQLLEELLDYEFQSHFCPNDGSLALCALTDTPLKARALFRLWLTKLGQPMPTTRQLTQIFTDVVAADTDRQPQFQLGDRILRRYQQRLYLTPHFALIAPTRWQLSFVQPLELPDQIGVITLTKRTDEKIQVNWQTKQAQHQTILPAPAPNQPIYIGLGYQGKVKLAPSRPREIIKKVWQQYGVPPWQRSRIPLVFYDNQLRAALGHFQTYVED